MSTFKLKQMIKFFKILIAFLIVIQCYEVTNAQTINIGLVTNNGNPDRETVAAFDFLAKNPLYNARKIDISKLTNATQLENIDILWYHYSDTTGLQEYSDTTLNIINRYLTNGGKMLLTLEAFRLINDLGIEPNTPEVRYKKASDNGYGRMLGLHSFKSHPVFDGLNGGAYILKLLSDTVVRQIGYFDRFPILNGAVVAVDWDYIFVRENSKLMLEYWTGKGRLMALGEYVNLTARNLNRMHLEKFLNNTFAYLYDTDKYKGLNYWHYYDQEVFKQEFYDTFKFRHYPKPWHSRQSKMVIHRDSATGNFWDVAGERMLVMGKEKSGIDEIWSHPFMAFRDYEVSLKFLNSDSIISLGRFESEIEVRPESFTRIYNINGAKLEEKIVTSHNKPLGVIHYVYSGKEPVSLFIQVKSNLRLMWPYSENVIKAINCGTEMDINALMIKDESGDYSCIIGSNMDPHYMDIGQYSGYKIKWIPYEYDSSYFEFEPVQSDAFQALGIFQFDLLPGNEFSMVFAADNRSPENTIQTYKQYLVNNEQILVNSKQHYDSLLANSAMIKTPDTLFNEGYKWALIATDRFFVNTPGLGKSLVAGYSTTDRGWDGGQKISGRPGYAWYFGRDGEWSGFALLNYGDFDKVKHELEFYQKFQDLNGKIFHEVSTSGFVHYDASDATPLYIVLAGRYLHSTGDVDFIKKNWPNIKKAIDFCYSTDTDNDHLIENTNVGHGWVEGGGLFGSHTSLYLASCWAAALDEAAYMAGALDLENEAEKYRNDSKTVTDIINNKFWDKKTDYYYHGLLKEGGFIDEQTIMPAIPMLFGQAGNSKAKAVLPILASDDFSTDWGSRIVKESSKLFNPNGYHTGSVWPLFTGWSALADYKYGNPVQGFSQIMDNLRVYQNWGLGFVEEVLNGETYKPSGVCPHQCWSETMVLQPAIEGMLGFEPDAINHTVKLSPKLPADWDFLEIKNLKAGNHSLNVEMKREKGVIKYTFQHQGGSNLKIIFNPEFPEGTVVNSIEISGDFESKPLSTEKIPQFYISKETVLTYNTSGGIEVLPAVTDPQPGDRSSGLRIISDRLDKDTYFVTVEGTSGTERELKIFCPGNRITDVKNATIISQKNDICTLKVKFAPGDEKYTKKIIQVRYK